MPPLGGVIFRMSGTGPNDVFAGTNASELAHWDGARWSPVRLPVATFTLYNIVGAIAATPTRVFVTVDARPLLLVRTP